MTDQHVSMSPSPAPPSLAPITTIVLWVAVLAWAGVIFAMSAQPGSSVPGRFATLAHFVEYGIFGLLLALAVSGMRPTPRTVAIAVLVASVYAVSDEFHQHFVPGRTPDVMDWAVDTLGATAGAAFWYACAHLLARRRERRLVQTGAERP